MSTSSGRTIQFQPVELDLAGNIGASTTHRFHGHLNHDLLETWLLDAVAELRHSNEVICLDDDNAGEEEEDAEEVVVVAVVPPPNFTPNTSPPDEDRLMSIDGGGVVDDIPARSPEFILGLSSGQDSPSRRAPLVQLGDALVRVIADEWTSSQESPSLPAEVLAAEERGDQSLASRNQPEAGGRRMEVVFVAAGVGASGESAAAAAAPATESSASAEEWASAQSVVEAVAAEQLPAADAVESLPPDPLGADERRGDGEVAAAEPTEVNRRATNGQQTALKLSRSAARRRRRRMWRLVRPCSVRLVDIALSDAWLRAAKRGAADDREESQPAPVIAPPVPKHPHLQRLSQSIVTIDTYQPAPVDPHNSGTPPGIVAHSADPPTSPADAIVAASDDLDDSCHLSDLVIDDELLPTDVLSNIFRDSPLPLSPICLCSVHTQTSRPLSTTSTAATQAHVDCSTRCSQTSRSATLEIATQTDAPPPVDPFASLRSMQSTLRAVSNPSTAAPAPAADDAVRQLLGEPAMLDLIRHCAHHCALRPLAQLQSQQQQQQLQQPPPGDGGGCAASQRAQLMRQMRHCVQRVAAAFGRLSATEQRDALVCVADACAVRCDSLGVRVHLVSWIVDLFADVCGKERPNAVMAPLPAAAFMQYHPSDAFLFPPTAEPIYPPLPAAFFGLQVPPPPPPPLPPPPPPLPPLYSPLLLATGDQWPAQLSDTVAPMLAMPVLEMQDNQTPPPPFVDGPVPVAQKTPPSPLARCEKRLTTMMAATVERNGGALCQLKQPPVLQRQDELAAASGGGGGHRKRPAPKRRHTVDYEVTMLSSATKINIRMLDIPKMPVRPKKPRSAQTNDTKTVPNFTKNTNSNLPRIPEKPPLTASSNNGNISSSSSNHSSQLRTLLSKRCDIAKTISNNSRHKSTHNSTKPPPSTAMATTATTAAAAAKSAAKLDLCRVCGGRSRIMCNTCRLIAYCGSRCMNDHHDEHAKICFMPDFVTFANGAH